MYLGGGKSEGRINPVRDLVRVHTVCSPADNGVFCANLVR